MKYNVHVHAQGFQTVSRYVVTSFLSADCINTSTSLEVQCLQFLTLSIEQPVAYSRMHLSQHQLTFNA